MNKTEENDNRILKLKEILNKKKELVKEKPTSSFKTNCMFTMFGTTYNLHTMNSFELNMMLSWLKSINNPEMVIENNYKIKDYLTDIVDKLVLIDYNNTICEIKKLESKLDSLISQEKKTSLEIDKLEELIKGK